MTKEQHIYSVLGLAKKAGYAKGGEFLAEKSVKEGRSRMVIVAGDASENTKKKFDDMCTFYKVPIVVFGCKDELGHAIGAEFRAMVTVDDQGFARKLTELIGGN